MSSSAFLRRGALAAILVAGCLVPPAAVAQSPERGSGGNDPARANVYVPPSPDTATRQGKRGLDAHPAPRDLPSARKKANVYVPPSGSYADHVSSLSDEQLAGAYGTAIPNSSPSPSGTQTMAHAASPAADDGASPWAVLGLALGCAALLGGAGLALVHRLRRARRTVA
jgi:hypothetical protein